MKKSKKQTYLIAFLLIFSGFIFLVYTSIKSESVYFLNVSEALAKEKSDLKNARLFGIVGKNIEKKGEYIEFPLLDKDYPEKKILVKYSGGIPDTFKIGSEVIVEGGFTKNVFNAKVLMTKCPSKYQKRNRKDVG
ncbi:cytochrome c maturation protein CcmE [Desulfothermus okinawensis JCM 13304]